MRATEHECYQQNQQDADGEQQDAFLRPCPVRGLIRLLVEQAERQLGHEGLPKAELQIVLDLEPPQIVGRVFDAAQVDRLPLVEPGLDGYDKRSTSVAR